MATAGMAMAQSSSTDRLDDPNATPPPYTETVALSCTFVIHGTLGSGSPDHASTSGNQLGRLNRNGVVSSCAVPKACAIFDLTPGRAYDAYSFTNETGATACVSVSLEVLDQAGCNLQVNAYLGLYDPNNVCVGYLADPGLSSGIPPSPISMSFDVPAGQVFILVVHTTNPGEYGCHYTLMADGDVCSTTPVKADGWGQLKVMYR